MESLLVFAILIEAVITNIRWVVEEQFNWIKIVSLVLGVALALIYQIDLVGQLGFVSIVPYVGNVLTGIILSRGSNFVYEIIANLKANRELQQ